MVPAVDVKHPDVGSWRSLTVGLHLPAEDGHTGVGRCNWKKIRAHRENRGRVKCVSAFITLNSTTQSALRLFMDSIPVRCSLTLGLGRGGLTFVHAAIPVRMGSELLDGLTAQQASVSGLSPERKG